MRSAFIEGVRTMSSGYPNYLHIPAEQLGEGTQVAVSIGGDMADLAHRMAEAMVAAVAAAEKAGREPTLIIPVGPVDQFPILAEMINNRRLDWRKVVLINMDEYLTDDDQWVASTHPLSFRGYMNHMFYDLIDKQFAPLVENRVFPNPAAPDEIGQLIEQRGGVEACFGGIGINGHMAFNEPPEPGDAMSAEAFAKLPTRVLDLSRETRTINSVTVGGEISIIPHRAITVGMKEILDAKKLRFYCNRIWQSSVVRRVLHGPITAACPASLIRTHGDAQLTIAEYTAAPPDIRLR